MKTEQPFNKYLRLDVNYKLAVIVREAISIAKLSPEQIVKSCLTCEYFKEETETCMMFNAQPAARVIAFGCETYSNITEELPF